MCLLFRYKNDKIRVAIYAQTGGNQLNYWWPKIEFKNEFLRYEKVSKSKIWEDLKFLVSKDEANAAGKSYINHIKCKPTI